MTPQEEQPKLAVAISPSGIGSLFLKREDLHKYKSHKGRSIPNMIEKHAKEGIRDFVISSSGNAALAASLYIQEYNASHPNQALSLQIFVGKKISPAKLRMIDSSLTDPRLKIFQTERPLQSAILLEKESGRKLLRQSTDDSALIGYDSLSLELNQIPNLEAVFIATSSGTTAQALHMHFQKKGANPEIHVVQTTGTSPIASEFDKDEILNEISFADAIVDKLAMRKDAVAKAISDSAGGGWIASNQEIAEAIHLIEQNAGIKATANGALSVAGLARAVKKGRRWKGSVVCIITGA